jgi:AcrR family transcriptional regulator
MAGQVAEPTLRHYFGDRESVAREILAVLGERGRPFMDAVAQPSPGLDEAVDAYVGLSKAGVRHGGFARAHAFGLIEGLADDTVGRAYLDELLEPSLQALEERLSAHAGELTPTQKRAAALILFAPMLLAILHQDLLGGRRSAPLDLDGLFDAFASFAKAAIGDAKADVQKG